LASVRTAFSRLGESAIRVVPGALAAIASSLSRKERLSKFADPAWEGFSPAGAGAG